MNPLHIADKRYIYDPLVAANCSKCFPKFSKTFISGKVVHTFFDHFADTQVAGFVNAQNSGGTITYSAPTTGHYGVVSLNALASGAEANLASQLSTYYCSLNNSMIYTEWYIKTPAVLSNGTATYLINVGFGDSTTTDFTDGVWFKYLHSESANWRAATSSNSVRSFIDTGVTVAINTWYRMAVYWDKSNAYFYIDNNLVATTNLNIPNTTARNFGTICQIDPTVGAVNQSVLADYVYMEVVWNIAR